MKKTLLLALCFLAINAKAQDNLKTVLTNGNSAGQKNIRDLKTLRVGEITTNDSVQGGLKITTHLMKPLDIVSSKTLTLQTTGGTININTNGQAGILLNGFVGIGQGCNYSTKSPVNSIIWPPYQSVADAIADGLGDGDTYRTQETDSSWTLKVIHLP